MLTSLAVLFFVACSAAQGIQPYSGKDDGLSQHTIYMPNTKGKIPVLVFSSGGCFRDGGRQHLQALQETSTHGIMIIAMGILSSPGSGGSGGKGKEPYLSRRQGKGTGGNGVSGMGSNVSLQEEAFTWLSKNAGKGKYANIDISRVAVAGQSCGGLESYNAANNPMVKGVGIFNSGMFTSSPIVKGLTKPVFYFIGGQSDIAYQNAERDFKELPKETPTWKGNLNVGHYPGTWTQPKGGKFGTAMWNWLDWTLRGNASCATFFTGDGPGSAKDDGWTVERRALDKISITPIS